MNLHELTPEVLTELTNVGTVRRASKDLDVAIEWSEGPGGSLLAAAADGTECRLGPGPFDDWECTCPAMFKCRHLVRAVLVWQREHPVGAGDDGAADGTGGAAADGAGGEGAGAEGAAAEGAGVPTAEAPDDASATAGTGPATQPPGATGTDAPSTGTPSGAVGDLFPARLRATGERLAAGGITARVSAVPRLRVRLLHPMDIGVRYPVGTDPRYARCECGAPTCVHLYLAERARELAAPDLAHAYAVLVDTTAPGADLIDPGAWHAWLDQLLEVGLGAADALIGGAVRLATSWEEQGRVHPAAALREVVTQLEHQRARDAQLSPERLLLLIGEVEARLRALAVDGPAPAAVVAGRPDAEVAGESARLLGLGAEWTHVGGWNTLRTFALDVRTGAVLTLVAEREDTTERLVQPADLLRERRSGATLADWAAGAALVPRFTRRGDQLAIGRTRVAVAPTPSLDLDSVAAVVPENFADLAAQLFGVPGPLGPRRPSDGVQLCRVSAVEDVDVDPVSTTVRAVLVDAAGERAELALPWGPRTADGARRLVGLLTAGAPIAVAGRWRTGEDGLDVVPTAVWVPGGVLLPQVDLALGCDPRAPEGWPNAGADPWRTCWDAVAEPLGRLLVLGSLRGATTVSPALTRAATQAEAHGLTRLAGLATDLAAALPQPADRRRAFTDACVLLAFAA